ncbi:MAG: hypothetical protein R3E89_05130 [Thiolinea sp.]
MSRQVIQARNQQQKKLNNAQKKFNATIRKIEKQKKLLAEWMEMTQDFQQKQAGIYAPLMQRYNTGRAELVRRLDTFFPRKSFSSLQREKMAHAICAMAGDLIPGGFDDLREIHDRYSDMDFASIENHDKLLAEDMIRDMVAAEFGIELDDEFDLSRPEKVAEELLDRIQEKEQQTQEQHSQQKKTAAQQRRETQQQQEEENISQSIK